MKILITEVCTGKPDGGHEIVYTDGREYDLPEEFAKRLIKEGKATTPTPPYQGGEQGEVKDKKSKKEVRDGKE